MKASKWLEMFETKETTQMREAPPTDGTKGSELIFVEKPDMASWMDAVSRLRVSGHHRIGARLFDAEAVDIGAALSAEYAGSLEILESHGDTGRNQAGAGPRPALDAVLLIGRNAECISTALLDYVDDSGLTVYAPVTDRFWQKMPLYLISIPKAGTHLLFRLAEAMGYTAGGLGPQQPVGGHWYYLLNSNAHTSAIEFFGDELQKAPFGNRAHPFMRSPALFNYRNPLDILVSEANYWHLDGRSPLSVLLSPLSFEERVERLIDNRWQLGSLRDRVGGFYAWLDCTNVIPVSFEEMVGDSGGGSNETLESLIWSLQLKLHVPGRPAVIRLATSDRSSATFREGKINGWRKQIPPESLKKLKALPPDFMAAYGYKIDTNSDKFKLPARAMEFRRRPLRMMTENHLRVPILIESDYLGYNIVSYMNRYYAIEIATGEIDLAKLPGDELNKRISADNLPSLRGLIGINHIEGALKVSVKKFIEESVERNVARSEQEHRALSERLIHKSVAREAARLEVEAKALSVQLIHELVGREVTHYKLEQKALSERLIHESVERALTRYEGEANALRERAIHESVAREVAQYDQERKAADDQLICESVSREVTRCESEARLLIEQIIHESVGREIARVESEQSAALTPVVEDKPSGEDAIDIAPQVAAMPETPVEVHPDAPAEVGDERVGPVGPPTPFLGYNLFKRRNGVIALPMSLGAIDPRDYEMRSRPGVIASGNELGARLQVFGMWLRWAYWDGAKI